MARSPERLYGRPARPSAAASCSVASPIRSIERTLGGSDSASSSNDSPLSEPPRIRRGGRRSSGVLAVVRSRKERLGGQFVPGLELDVHGPAWNRSEVPRDDGDVRLGLVLEDTELRGAVVVVACVPVEVVGLEVEQHGDARAETMHVL